jgi:fibro-slime domain-containing protein
MNSNKSVAALTLALGAGLVASIGYATSGSGSSGSAVDIYSSMPTSVTLSATIRDFKANGQTGGHPDFEVFSGSKATPGLVQSQLDANGKPAFRQRSGRQISNEWRNARGQNIMPSSYNASAGDREGTWTSSSQNQLTSAERFNQWYNDTPGVNASASVDLVLNRTPGTGTYVFDSANDEPYKSKGGFFPIDGQLFGNYTTWGKNFHFTTEISANFVYEAGRGLTFKFTGDDDVWVFVDGNLVLDLGGLHPRCEQVVELDRLGLVDGRVYPFKIFHAERRTNQSNFRMETNLLFRSAGAPQVTGIFD